MSSYLSSLGTSLKANSGKFFHCWHYHSFCGIYKNYIKSYKLEYMYLVIKPNNYPHGSYTILLRHVNKGG